MPRSVLIKLQNCQPNTKLCTTVKKLEQKSRATGVSDFFFRWKTQCFMTEDKNFTSNFMGCCHVLYDIIPERFTKQN